LQHAHVLVVDDNECARELLVELTSKFGMRSRSVGGGREALDAVALADANDEPFDLVLLDWKMPGMDGLDCLRHLGQMPQRHRAPTVLMLTAFSRDEVLHRLTDERLDVAATLTKPVTPSTLLDACLTTLGLARRHTARAVQREDALLGQHASLAGARILLVEDHAINQELARDLLTQAGIRVQVAGDGAAALDVLRRESFDAVLMDCQMPVMDGYAATRAIREQPKWRDLPVIAMTANAMVGDREKVLAAGMNDHIAKPIRVEDLFATLARWVHPTKPLPGAAKGMSSIVPDDLPGIDRRTALTSVMGDGRLYRRVLGMFLDREADFGARFAAARAAHDSGEAMRMAHDLKSVAASLGAQPLSEVAAALEQACSTNASASEVDACLGGVMVQLEPVIAGLRAHLAPTADVASAG
jgi:CheY-like chemotaxis protein/HPt (histidine-containing phosphotransfer) domain-containing protein